MAKKLGVILSGCGFLDGAEIRESVLTLLAIDKLGAKATVMAPNKNQHHTVNHSLGEQENGVRNVLIESARIARGEIQDISQCDPSSLDGLILPGGFGVAKNLSNFAFDGPNAEIEPLVEEFILKIHGASKPIGAICISPAVLCLALGDKGPEVTIGRDRVTAEAIEALGGKHIECNVDQAHVDRNLKIVSTPAYMYDDASLADVATGIEACVFEVLKFL